MARVTGTPGTRTKFAAIVTLSSALLSLPPLAVGQTPAAEQDPSRDLGPEVGKRQHLELVSETRMRMESMLRERAAAEAAVDRRPLLARKFAVDSALVPALLLLEISGSGRHDPLALLRFDYRDEIRAVNVPQPATTAAIDALHALWVDAATQGITFGYRSERLGAEGEDFPALIQWRGRIEGDRLRLVAQWFEPFLASRRLDFPLNPEQLSIEFSQRHATITSPLPEPVLKSAAFAPPPPQFNNPTDAYDLFDGLRAAAWTLHRPASLEPGHLPYATVADATLQGEERHQRFIRTVEWADSPAGLERCTIWQPVVMLTHQSAHRLVGEARVAEVVVGESEVASRADLPWIPSGLQAEIRFRALHPGIDESATTPAIDSRMRVPASIELLTRGATMSTARFDAFDFGGPSPSMEELHGSQVALVQEVIDRLTFATTLPLDQLNAGFPPLYAENEILGAIDPLLARWRLRVNLLLAARNSDQAAHDRAITLMLRRLAEDGVSNRWVLMNAQAWVEELAGPLELTQAAVTLGLPAWLSIASQLEPADQLAEVARLIVGGRWGLALVLARSLKSPQLPPGGAGWIERVTPRLEAWARRSRDAPLRSGPHPEWDARIDRTMIELIDSGVTP